MRAAAFAVLLAASVPLAAVTQAAAQAVTVTAPWARATPPGATTGAIYMTLTSPNADRLTGVTTPAAASASVHETITANAPAGAPAGGPSGAQGGTMHGMNMAGMSMPGAAQGQVMQMREVKGGLPLPPGQPVTLKPGGYHIMLEGLRAPLQPGHALTLHLTFETAPPADVTVPVQKLGAPAPAP